MNCPLHPYIVTRKQGSYYVSLRGKKLEPAFDDHPSAETYIGFLEHEHHCTCGMLIHNPKREVKQWD